MWFSHIYLRQGMSEDLAKVEYIKARRAPQSTEKVKSFLQMKDTITIGCDSGPEGTDKGQHRVRVDTHMPEGIPRAQAQDLRQGITRPICPAPRHKALCRPWAHGNTIDTCTKAHG